jgi:DNA-directed RNA polymerase specialized sigma24 family protein
MTPVDAEAARVGAFEAFYRERRVEAVRLAWLLTHDAAAAEDVAQDAFAAVFAVFERVDSPAAYLRRSVINGVYERTRRRQREQRRNGLMIAGELAAVDGPTGGVLDAVAALPLNQRTAVVLRFWAGLRDHEIADAMGIRPGTARSLLSRATTHLRKDLLP